MPPHPRITWGISSVGRAVASHATGQGFESPMLHLIPETESENNLVRFLLCIDFQSLRKPRHCSFASDATAPPGAKGSTPNIVEFEFSYHDVPTFN